MRRMFVLASLAAALAACSNPLSPASGTVDGAAIAVFGPYRGVEADNFAASLRGFEEATGIAVNYTGSADFVSDLRQRVESGLDAPDVAVIPQPGVIAELVDRGAAVPLGAATLAAIDQHYGQRAADLTAGSDAYVAPYRVSAKSLLWYRPDVFEQQSWSVPTTLDELVELVERIEDDQDDSTAPISPWCFAMASGSATTSASTAEPVRERRRSSAARRATSTLTVGSMMHVLRNRLVLASRPESPCSDSTSTIVGTSGGHNSCAVSFTLGGARGRPSALPRLSSCRYSQGYSQTTHRGLLRPHTPGKRDSMRIPVHLRQQRFTDVLWDRLWTSGSSLDGRRDRRPRERLTDVQVPMEAIRDSLSSVSTPSRPPHRSW